MPPRVRKKIKGCKKKKKKVKGRKKRGRLLEVGLLIGASPSRVDKLYIYNIYVYMYI